MTDDASQGAGRSETDWDSPRWREGEARQGDVEREHRLRDEKAPTQRGAIDREGSVGGEKQDLPEDPQQGKGDV